MPEEDFDIYGEDEGFSEKQETVEVGIVPSLCMEMSHVYLRRALLL